MKEKQRWHSHERWCTGQPFSEKLKTSQIGEKNELLTLWQMFPLNRIRICGCARVTFMMMRLKSQREKQMHAGSVEFDTIMCDLGREKHRARKMLVMETACPLSSNNSAPAGEGECEQG